MPTTAFRPGNRLADDGGSQADTATTATVTVNTQGLSMITPTVGRVVWFYPKGHPENAQPLAAIVAHVWSDTCVNLAIFDANGCPMTQPPTSVLLVQPGNPVPSGGHYCTWMPYQIGQAQKQAA